MLGYDTHLDQRQELLHTSLDEGLKELNRVPQHDLGHKDNAQLGATAEPASWEGQAEGRHPRAWAANRECPVDAATHPRRQQGR